MGQMNLHYLTKKLARQIWLAQDAGNEAKRAGLLGDIARVQIWARRGATHASDALLTLFLASHAQHTITEIGQCRDLMQGDQK